MWLWSTMRESTLVSLSQNFENHCIQGGWYGSALQAASLTDKQMVRLFLDHDADVNAQGGEYVNTFWEVIHHGEDAMVRLLADGCLDAYGSISCPVNPNSRRH